MIYLLFLVSILISSIFYFQLSKRFSVFDMELSDDMRREITSLITEFNQSARQNIEIIEDRILQSKDTIKNLAQQIEYVQQLKETLENEVKETYKKLSQLKENEKKIYESNRDAIDFKAYQSSYVQNFYQHLNSQDPEKSMMEKKKKKVAKEVKPLAEDSLASQDIDFLKTLSVSGISDLQSSDPKALFDSKIELKETTLFQYQNKKNVSEKLTSDSQMLDLVSSQEDLVTVSEEVVQNKPTTPATLLEAKSQIMQDIKKEVILQHKKGIPISEIATKLNLTKGEVNFIIKINQDF